jgi:hypothetical protein
LGKTRINPEFPGLNTGKILYANLTAIICSLSAISLPLRRCATGLKTRYSSKYRCDFHIIYHQIKFYNIPAIYRLALVWLHNQGKIPDDVLVPSGKRPPENKELYLRG